MAVLEGIVSGQLAGVGAETSSPLHVTAKPLFHGVLGHYRYSIRVSLVGVQAADSRLWSLRNGGSNLIVPTSLSIGVLQYIAGTAQENGLDLYKATAFTVSDTTNTSTPGGISRARTGNMTAAPGNAALRHVTISGVAAGMTGGTMTLSGNIIGAFPFLVNAAVPTTPNAVWGPFDFFKRDNPDVYPFVLAPDEGIVLTNSLLGGAVYGVKVFITVSWAEVTAY